MIHHPGGGGTVNHGKCGAIMGVCAEPPAGPGVEPLVRRQRPLKLKA